MTECNVCFDASSEVRHFLPCGCRIWLCDACVKQVVNSATFARCLWCRKQEESDSEDDALLASIQTLKQKLHDAQWQNTLLRVEMYHFKRHQFYHFTGFCAGVLLGLFMMTRVGLFMQFAMFASVFA